MEETFTTYIDEVDANTTYLGSAPRGSSTADDSWQIKKILVNGTITSITYPNGDAKMAYVWDSRSGYTYS